MSFLILEGDISMVFKRFRNAESVLLARYEEWKESLGKRHSRTQKARVFLIQLYMAWGKEDLAERFRAEYQTVKCVRRSP
jgi:hypothetical protein